MTRRTTKKGGFVSFSSQDAGPQLREGLLSFANVYVLTNLQVEGWDVSFGY